MRYFNNSLTPILFCFLNSNGIKYEREIFFGVFVLLLKKYKKGKKKYKVKDELSSIMSSKAIMLLIFRSTIFIQIYYRETHVTIKHPQHDLYMYIPLN